MDPTASYNYHRKSTDDAKSVHSTRTARQPLFKRPTMNPFSSGTSPTPPPLLSDNEVAADPLEAAVSPTTQFFEQPQNRHMFLEQPTNGNGRTSTMPVDSKERKNLKPFGHRLRSVLSNAHLAGRKDSSRRTSPEMSNYDTHSLSQTLHPDYRRPSYASQTTQSSTGSRRSHTEISSTDSPMYGSTSLPQSLDPSELSLITNLPPASATALDSQIYATANNSNTTNGNSRLTPVSYPDPEQVFDTRSMYQEQQNARAMQEFYEHEPQSRADSISSSVSDAKPKKNKSLFNLLRRRESSTDLVSEKSSSNSLYKGLKHKASESFLPLRHASQSSQFTKAPTTSSKLHFPHHKSSLAYEKEAYPSSNGVATSPKPQVRQRSKSSSYQPSNPPTKPLPPVPNVPQLENIPNDMLNDFRSSRMFSLDTDLGKMQGIVQQADQPNPNEAKRRPTSSQSLDLAKQLKPLTPYATNNVNPMDTYQVNKGQPINMGQAITRAPQVRPPNSTSKWTAPESWGVKENAPTPPPAWGDGFDQEMTIRRNNTAQFYCLRVFREDGTFSTLSCAIGITVDELKEKIATKFFISRTANGTVQGYELTARTGGLTRILGSQEKPLMYQKMLLEFMGYTDNDRLQDVGREDLSYLCRFEFRRSAMKSFTPEEDALMTRDFVHVNLQRMSLQTIPIVFYQHTSEIELLDVSKNPSIALPLDFIQSCVNLRQVRFSDNQARKFPANIDRATKLAKLDLSNNLILEIDHIDFAHFPHLRSLDLQGNRLKSVAPSIAIAQLRHLNLSSNNLTQLPDEICTMITLIDLDLSFNHISQLPVRIGDLVNLERLLMTNNDLTLKLPDSFSELRSLRELDVRYNKLQNIDILSHLPKLEVLYCTKNQVYSFDDSFYRLKLFYFDRNPITRVAFKELQLSLAVLNLSKAKLTAIPENFLEKIPTVEKLVLDKNHLVSLPPQIGLLKKLVSLSIVSNKLSSLPPEIGQLQELQFLDLHSNNLKSLPDEIWSLTSLSVLNASSNLLDNFPRPTLHMSSVSSGNSGLYRNAIDSNYEMHVNGKRRQSQFSNASGVSPKDLVSSRRGSGYPPSQLSSNATTPGTPSPMHRGASVAEGMFQHQQQQQQQANRPRGLSHCLLVLSLADNRLQDECFNPISHLTSLRILNLSYNDLLEVPSGALGMLPQLTELYLSGNGLSGLPSDDFESNQSLRVFHANGNKLHSLPAELGKMPHLSVLDVGSNNLRYNINNWPYDWNWNWNLSLKYLNFSGNQKLEVKRDQNRGVRDTGERNLSDFTVLEDIRVLGLMDVTLTIPSVPDQTENCRVRTYGSSVLNMKYGMADSIGNHNNLSIMDMVVERFRGNEKEAILGLFDGRNASEEDGNKVSKLIQETFGTVFSEELSKLREGETTSDALRRAFLYTNKEIGNTTMLSTEEIAHSSIAHRSSTAANLNPQDRMTGSCATIVYLNDNKLYVANVGDSMAILTKSAFGEYTVLTTRHDPTTQEELARIRGGAGVVSATGKLDGILDVSRAIGFYNLIPHIHAAPSIFEYELTGSEDYLIVASKQLWEYVSYENAFDVARTQLHNPMLAAQKLRDFAIAYGCTDKIMVMVLAVGTRNKRPSLSRVGASNLASGGGFSYQIPGYEEELFPSIKKRRDRSFLPEDSTLARLGSEVKPPTGDVAMVFTDIKNSTLLWETYPVAMRSAIKIHNDIMRRQILLMRGYEVKTEGDAFIVSFPTPTSALLWCFSVQQRLLVADWPAEILASEQGYELLDDNGEIIFRGLSVRMGIHWGTPVSELDVITKRMDYFGPMVNRTARISAVADGGQITLSTDFLSEMKLLTQANEKVEKDGASLQEAFGTEIIGEAISKDISMLNNLGWVVKEIGEMKLKGLENPELISVAYPKNLEARYTYHSATRDETPNPNGTLTAPPVQIAQSAVSSPSIYKGANDGKSGTGTLSPTKRVGTLTFDLLVKLRGIADRLEKVCSQMNNADGMGSSRKQFSQYQRQSARNLVAVVPSSDKDYVALFEHLVTRVENALSTLYIRAAVNQARGDDGGAYTAELADLLTTLATLLAK